MLQLPLSIANTAANCLSRRSTTLNSSLSNLSVARPSYRSLTDVFSHVWQVRLKVNQIGSFTV